MKILVFTEGTILMHLSAKNVSREKRVKQSQTAGIQRLVRNLVYRGSVNPTLVPKGSVYDLANYMREITKHAEYKNDEAGNLAETVREHFWTIINDYNIDPYDD